MYFIKMCLQLETQLWLHNEYHALNACSIVHLNKCTKGENEHILFVGKKKRKMENAYYRPTELN